ncbi:hypothetical protein C0995_007100 [Termitomyces sp. Mi166|nr:hypothetical protein C0995_007100 [Termitomyces sp. Mi166\
MNLWSLNKQASWCAEFGKTVLLPMVKQVSWEHAICTIEQIRLMHFEKMAIKLEPTVLVVVPKTVVNPAPTPASATLLIQHLHSELSLQEQEEVHAMGKGKAKEMEDDKDEEGEAAQKLRKELEDFVVLTKFDDKLLVSLLLLPSEYYEGDIGLLQGAKILGGRKGVVSPTTWALVLEKNGAGYKGKGKAKALLDDSEQTGAKQTFKLTELVDSDSNKGEEEERVHVIKKIKHEHVKELTGTRKGKEIIELENEVEIVAPKTPMAGPS